VTERGKAGWAFVLLAIATVAFGGWHYGWLNDDALNYLILADRISLGHLPSLRPSWGDHYWAVFPAGYPTVIAAFSLLTQDAFTASKIANAVLMAGSIALTRYWLKLPLLVVASLFFCLPLLQILSFSWSENAFIFAQMLALCSLGRYLETGTKAWLAPFGLGLLLLLSSRYIGGFALAGYGLALAALWWSQPRKRLVAAAGVIKLAILAFGAYVLFNIQQTGFPTGMGRAPAPESLRVLITHFARELAYSVWMLIPPLALLWLTRATGTRPSWRFCREEKLLFIVGTTYLAILFALRSTSRFEQFSGRLLCPGMILIWLGVLHHCFGVWQESGRHRAAALVLAALFFIGNTALLYRDFFYEPELATTHSAQRGLEKYEEKYGHMPDGTVIISGGYLDPSMSWSFISPIFSDDRIFYVVADNFPLSLEEYRGYISRLRYKGQPVPLYLFDYSEFDTVQSLSKMLEKRRVDPGLAAWIKSHFKPRSFVECRECKMKQKLETKKP